VDIQDLLRRGSMTSICPFGCKRLDITLTTQEKCKLYLTGDDSSWTMLTCKG
jgi:hypothetical protein